MLRQARRLEHSTARAGGFTLTELLVVLFAVTLLMGLLAPALKGARERAHQVTCAMRLKQWGNAFSCYAVEHNGMWPHCDGLDRGPKALTDPHITPEDLADWHGWMDLLPPMLDYRAWRDYPRYQRPDNATFYQCPSGRPLEADGLYSYRPRRDGYFSYAMNSCLELDKNAWPPPGKVGYPMPSFVDSGRVVRPERVYLLFDQLLDPRKGFDAKVMYRGAGKYSGSYPKAFAERHRHGLSGLGGNILFCDGHVDWQRSVWKPEWDPEQEVPPRHDPNWYPYPAIGGGVSSSGDPGGVPGRDP